MFLKKTVLFFIVSGFFVAGTVSTDQLAAAVNAATDVVATASATLSGAVDVTWTNATSSPQPTGYSVMPLKDDVEVPSLAVQFARNGQTQSTRTVTGLTDGTAYTFRVDAVYLVGSPVPSALSASAIPYDVPAVPTLEAVSGDEKVTLTWTSVDDNGSSVTAYVVEVTPKASTTPAEIAGTSTTAEVTGLTNGTSYSFTLKAQNLRGESAASAPVSSTPIGPPSTMVAPTVTAGNESATVSWTAPIDSGGSEIVSYTITGTSSTAGAASPVSKSVTVASLAGVLSTQVTSLTNSKVYSFTVTATNGGPQTSESSPSSLSVTPSDTPPAAISAVSPNYSAVSGGELISFSGSNLTGSTITATCSDSSTPTVASPTVSATLVTVESPPCPLGVAQLTLANAGNPVKVQDVTYLAVPTITSLTPNSITSTGSHVITLIGTNLSTGISSETLLRIGGTSVSLNSITPTSITFNAPNLINGETPGIRTVQVILGNASETLATLPSSMSITYTATANTISFSDIPLKRFGSAPFTISASASAGTVVFTSLTTGVCTVSGTSITIIAAGNCRIIGTSTGSSIYEVGTGEKLIVIERGNQTLSVSPVSAISVGASTSISVTNSAGDSGGLKTFESSTPTVCSISSTGLVQGISSGDCIVVVTASETGNYSSATATTTFVVTSTAPVVTTTIPSVSVTKLKKGKTISTKSIARKAGTTITAGSKVVLSVAKSSKLICVVNSSKSGVRGIKAGKCKITIKVTPKATKKVKRPKTVTKPLLVVIT